MEDARIGILKEAVETRRKKESFEEAVGRVVRKRGLDFSAYVAIMSEVREQARRDKVTVDKAAGALLRDRGKDAE